MQKILRFSLIASYLLLFTFWVNAQDERIKALFIYNFTKYIEWPESYKTGDFIIAVLGETPVFDQLVANTATRKVATQSIQVKKYSKVNDVERCHVLFIPQDKSAAVKSAVELIKNWSTLLVTDYPSTDKIFGLNFIKMEGKQTFEINTEFLDQKKLIYNTGLLKLGVKVK